MLPFHRAVFVFSIETEIDILFPIVLQTLNELKDPKLRSYECLCWVFDECIVPRNKRTPQRRHATRHAQAFLNRFIDNAHKANLRLDDLLRYTEVLSNHRRAHCIIENRTLQIHAQS